MLPRWVFSIFDSTISISMYNILIGIGIILGLLVFQINCKRKKIPNKDLDNLTVIIGLSIIFGFIFAALFDKIVHAADFSSFVSNLLSFTGLTFEGGLLGGIFVFFILYKMVMKNFKNILSHINSIIPSVVIAHSIGRIGCFFGGCCFGKPTDYFVGVLFPADSLAAQTYGQGVKVLPTQLFEAVFLLILFLLLLFLVNKNEFVVYLVSYGLFRFIIEFFRGDNRGVLLQTLLSPSQVVSLFMVLAGILLFLIRIKNSDAEEVRLEM